MISKDLTRLALIALLVLSCFGCDRRTKEQLLQEGLELKAQQNLNGAIVLMKNALEKDPNYLKARHQLGLIYLAGGQYGKAEKELEKVMLQDPGNSEVLLDLAEARLLGGHADEAVKMLGDRIKEHPSSLRAHELLGRSLAVEGCMEEAEEVYRQALALDKTSREARNGLARLYGASRRSPAALALVRESIAQDPQNREAHYLLMQLEGAAGNLEGAVAAGRQLLKEFPGELRAIYLLGVLELNRGNTEAAGQLAADLTARHPDHPAGNRLQGLVLFARQNYAEAVERLQQSLKQMPDLAGRYFLGLAHYHQAEYELALNQFQAILDSKPDHVQARLMIAQTLFRQQRFDDSRAAAELVLHADPDNALAHDILGSVFLAQGNFDRGMEEMDRAIDLAPDLVDAQTKKGLFYLAQGDLAKAESPLEEAVRIAPEILNTRLMLAVSYLRRQNFNQAVATLKEGFQGRADDAVLHNYLAAAYLRQGKTDEALTELEQAKQLKPDYLAPYVNLANFHLSKGRPAAAAAEYQALLKADPKNLRALLSLAALQELQGQKEQAGQNLGLAVATGAAEGFLAQALYRSRDGQPEAALATLQSGLGLHPRHPVLLELAGKTLSRLGRHEEALAAFGTLAEVQPAQGLPLQIAALVGQKRDREAVKLAQGRIEGQAGEPQGYLLLAGIHQQQQDYPKAEAVLNQGLPRVKNDLPLQMKLAELNVARQQPERALRIYTEQHEKHPEFLPLTFALGALYDQLGDKRQALALYRACLDSDGNYLPALNNLAYLYADNYRDLDEALQLAVRAFRQKPAEPGIMDTLGYVLVRKGRFGDALPYLEKSAALLPREPAVQLHLAQAYQGLGKRELAEAAAQKVIDSGDPSLAQSAKVLLQQLTREQQP
jgi:putative PEP-CTERM system TPR-repeat lipoprotein